MKKMLLLLCAFFTCIILSCSFSKSEENNGSVSFSIDKDLFYRIASRSVSYNAPENSELIMKISLSGGYEASAEIPVAEGSSVTFSDIPAGISVSATATVYKNSSSSGTGDSEEPVYSGITDFFSIKPGKNTVPLVLKKMIAVNLYNTGNVFYKTLYVRKGECLEEPEPPQQESTSEGEIYIFNGWYADDSNEVFDFTASITETTELYAKWTLMKVFIGSDDLSEIEVVMTKEEPAGADGAVYNFTADSGYDSYTWKIDGEASAADGTPFGTTNEFAFNTAGRASGSYDITLLASKTVDSEIKYYSFRTQILIE